jgi:hypothetical protein
VKSPSLAIPVTLHSRMACSGSRRCPNRGPSLRWSQHELGLSDTHEVSTDTPARVLVSLGLLLVLAEPVHAWLLSLFDAAAALIGDRDTWGMAVFVLLAAILAMVAFLSSAVITPTSHPVHAAPNLRADTVLQTVALMKRAMNPARCWTAS